MSLLFRDQCKDALGGAGPSGLAKLWLRVLVDMGTTACREHLFQIQQSMKQSLINSLFQKPTVTFGKVFTVTFLLLSAVLIITVVFLLPKAYSSTARVAVAKPNLATGEYDPYFIQTEFERITSKEGLNRVIEELGLKKRLSELTGARRLMPSESYQLLRRMVEVRQFRNTSMIEVNVYSEDRIAAAEIANRIVDVYRRSAEEAKSYRTVEVTDRAEPGLRPVRPNLPLNLFVGLISILAFAAILALLIRRFALKHSMPVT